MQYTASMEMTRDELKKLRQVVFDAMRSNSDILTITCDNATVHINCKKNPILFSSFEDEKVVFMTRYHMITATEI